MLFAYILGLVLFLIVIYRKETMGPYIRYARIYPAIICSIPFLLLQHYFLSNDYFVAFEQYLDNFSFVFSTTFTAVILYFFSEVNRIIGKDFFERFLFSNEYDMPTTQYLLSSNLVYSDNYKQKIKSKIEEDFGLKLLSREDEEKNELEARKLIVEAVGLIREKVGAGRLLLQYNWEYGFFRNLVGGSPLAFVVSVVDLSLFFGVNFISFYLSLFLTILFFGLVVFGGVLIMIRGKLYAKKLFSEYLNL